MVFGARPRSPDPGPGGNTGFFKGFHRKNWFSEGGHGAQIPGRAEKLFFFKGFDRKNWFSERVRGSQLKNQKKSKKKKEKERTCKEK